jgi:hypothetical protein
MKDDAFIREGMAFTSSLLSARKELDQIKEYTEGPNNLSDSIEIPNFPLSNELDSDFIISQDAINHSSFSPTQISDYNILPIENKLSDRFSISSDTESDVYEVPMSSPDIVSSTYTARYQAIHYKILQTKNDFKSHNYLCFYH